MAGTQDDDLWELARKMETYVKTRWYHLKGSPESFLGTEAVRWMMVDPSCNADNTGEAVSLGNTMIQLGIICHVSLQRPLPFANAPYFYCFTAAYRVNNRIKIDLATLTKLGGRLRAQVVVEDRQFQDDDDVVYPQCFVGSEAVACMVDDPCCPVSNVDEAVDLGSYMVAKGLLSYGVSSEGKPNLPFCDETCFYTFSPKIVPLESDEEIVIEHRQTEGGEEGGDSFANLKIDGQPEEDEQLIASPTFPASPEKAPNAAAAAAARAGADAADGPLTKSPSKTRGSSSPGKVSRSSSSSSKSPFKARAATTEGAREDEPKGEEPSQAAGAKPKIHRALLGPTLCRAINHAYKKEEEAARLRRDAQQSRDMLSMMRTQLTASQSEVERLQNELGLLNQHKDDVFFVLETLQAENKRLRSFVSQVGSMHDESDKVFQTRTTP